MFGLQGWVFGLGVVVVDVARDYSYFCVSIHFSLYLFVHLAAGLWTSSADNHTHLRNCIMCLYLIFIVS